MANIYRPCPNRILCPAVTRLVGQGVVEDPDSPFFNFSSEAPDPINYLGIYYGGDSMAPPDTPYQWGQMGNPVHITTGGYWSPYGQRDADDRARLAVQQGNHGGRTTNSPDNPWSSGPGGSPGDFYTNAEVTCGVDCEGGGTAEFTVEAGTIGGDTQEEADMLAESLCEERAGVNPICITTESLPGACIGEAYSEQVQATGGTPFQDQVPPYSYLYGVSDGALPGGLVMDPYTGAITGSPTTGGSYTFTVQALDAAFNIGSAEFTIVVIEITSSGALESGVESLAGYSQTPSATIPAGCTGVWSVTSGSLPPGLSLNSATGEISGTPDPGSKGDYSFELTLTVECP